ncbi:TPA: hypothetical protein IAA82_06845 [Candidatus Galligastranaerophilus gallistercoris]|nr:hypothetical protein [Candidatus Galligastranaerophilus gallistercoris]
MSLNAIGAYNAYQQQSINPTNNPFIGGGSSQGTSIWGNPQTTGVQTPPQTPATGTSYQKEINDVAMIGANKKQGFENGLGGTFNPDDHKLFTYA